MTMEDPGEQQEEGVEDPNYIGGDITDDVDHEMMESMFDLSGCLRE